MFPKQGSNRCSVFPAVAPQSRGRRRAPVYLRRPPGEMNSSNWDTILGLNPRHLAVSRRRRSDRAAAAARARLAAIFVRLHLQGDVPVHRVPRASRHRPLRVAGAATSRRRSCNNFWRKCRFKNDCGMIIQTALYDSLVFREGGGRAPTRAIF